MGRTEILLPNLVDPNTYINNDMLGIWRGLRSDEPVRWHPESSYGPGFWVLTRYADIAGVLRDDRRFTSEKGNVLAAMLQGGDAGAGRMLAVTDGPHHTGLRQLLIQAFSPRALDGVALRVRRVMDRLVAEAVEHGSCDFAKDIASIIPLETICDLLNVPVADRKDILRLTKSALASDHEIPDTDAERMARNEILWYFSDLVRERRKAPGADPISVMVTGEVGGKRLGDDDIVLNCYSLIMGGDETSRLSMIGAVQAFIGNPDEWQALRAGSVTLESAGEEVLRWTTPTMHFGRTAVADVKLHDRSIKSGDLITLWLTSANRDEAVFPRPDRFDLARSPNKHLSLGYGRHFCLGAYLARVEIKTMLDVLRTRVASIERAGNERPIYSNFLAGMSSLPVLLEGAR